MPRSFKFYQQRSKLFFLNRQPNSNHHQTQSPKVGTSYHPQIQRSYGGFTKNQFDWITNIFLLLTSITFAWWPYCKWKRLELGWLGHPGISQGPRYCCPLRSERSRDPQKVPGRWLIWKLVETCFSKPGLWCRAAFSTGSFHNYRFREVVLKRKNGHETFESHELALSATHVEKKTSCLQICNGHTLWPEPWELDTNQMTWSRYCPTPEDETKQRTKIQTSKKIWNRSMNLDTTSANWKTLDKCNKKTPPATSFRWNFWLSLAFFQPWKTNTC